ncbi:MAG: hypothetical protein II165_07300 [Bacteroidales bacterium]|nr:hypothetical protein [Bacteroidales bacterium]
MLLLLSSGVAAAQGFEARLANIRYYNSDSLAFPIKVSVCFEVAGTQPRNLSFVAKYEGNITYKAPVKEYDSCHAYYTFHSQLNKTTTLILFLEDKKGNRSATYTVNALPTIHNVDNITQP